MIQTIQPGTLQTEDGATISYFTFGHGQQSMVYIPGAGDGLATAHEASGRLKWWIKGYAQNFRVLYVSRRIGLTNISHVQMAKDTLWTMEKLGWGPSLVEGQSAGGAIAQQMAIMRPDLVPALVLSSTAGWLEESARTTIEHWRHLAQNDQWPEFFEGVARSMWRDRRMMLLKPFERILTQGAVPKDGTRLIAILDELLKLEHRPHLSNITSPTLVSAGDEDALFPPSQQRALADMIPNTHLYLGAQYGHGHDIANPAHTQRVLAFGRMNRRLITRPMMPPLAETSSPSLLAL